MTPSSPKQLVRLGTRGSTLARMQSQMVADLIENRHPGIHVELKIIKTTGDRIQDKPLHEFGGKGLFTKELEESLIRSEVDFVVHSLKDVPVTMPLVDISSLKIAAIPNREDPRDVLIAGNVRAIADLPPNAKVGTGSLRRRCQLLALRPDLRIEMIRGNIDTRVRKQREGTYDAVILAMAGLRRAGLFVDDMVVLPTEQLLPAAGQGALALQCRAADDKTVALLAVLNDPRAQQCVLVERQLVQLLQGDCHSPIAALAEPGAGGRGIRLRAVVGSRDGQPPIISAASEGSPEAALKDVHDQLQRQGAARMLGISHG